MANPAYENVSPIRPELRAVENKVADLNDGYVRLATTLLEAIAGADLTKRQFKVLLAVIRLTYGWNKAVDRIANSQISEIARLPVKKVSEARVQLIKMNILLQSGQQIGPNKNISSWSEDAFGESPNSGDENPPKQGIPQNGGLSPKTGDSLSPKTGESYPPKRGNTIDIIPKTYTDNKTPDIGRGENLESSELNRQEENPPIPAGKFAMFTGWKPSDDFRQRAATWGAFLPEQPYSPESLNAFVDYWAAEGKFFNHVQWEQKFARNLSSQSRYQPQAKTRALPATENFAAKDYGKTQLPSWAQEEQ